MKNAIAIADNPERVSTHGFLPFIKFEKRWTRFRHKEAAKKQKIRPLRYAARADAYIYIRYRDILSARYEAELASHGLGANVIAYRKIPVDEKRSGGKCNIHFSKEAFDFISKSTNCCAVALDISSYFDCIDHSRLKATWARLLGVEKLPDDHFRVYRSLTAYSEVERDALYVRLGFLKIEKNGSRKYTCPKALMPRQLCAPADFRLKVARDSEYGPKLILKNENLFGIPQGAAISDLLANAYLLEFDIKMAEYAARRGGFYRRYSDDILIIVPGDGRAGRAAREFASNLITQFGRQLKIKPEKSSTIKFVQCPSGGHRAERVGEKRRVDGLEYLGFRFDGKRIYLRDSTLSNLNRKIKRAARAVAHGLAARYPGRTADFVFRQLDLNAFMKKFGRVEDFEGNEDYALWTFWSYAKKAAQVFGPVGTQIFQQLKGGREKVEHLLRAEIADAVK